MRKLKFIIIFLFAFFAYINNSNALEYQCVYSIYNEDVEMSFSVTFDNEKDEFSAEFLDPDGKKIEIEETDVVNTISEIVYDINSGKEIKSQFYDGEIKGYKPNTCPYSLFLTYEDDEYKLYSDEYAVREEDYDCYRDDNWFWCLGDRIVGAYSYMFVYDKNHFINKNNEDVLYCPLYISVSKSIEIALQNYQNCSGIDCISYKQEIKKNVEILKQSCRDMLSYRDLYQQLHDKAAEEDNVILYVPDPCVKACIFQLSYLLNKTGEYFKVGECSFSERLLSFINNILKWIKYIVPVIVIVFGILDFIKALSSGKDDEMKKAQGRFMKRLIAAALVFIIPLIIEFILNKMGFGYDDCGLF